MEPKEENPLPAAAGVGEPIERRLEDAVIQTNEAVQAAAAVVEKLAATVAAVYGGGVNADVRD